MNLNTNELEIIRQALYSKVWKMEQEINRSFLKTGPSKRLDEKGREMDKVVEVMKRINQEVDIVRGFAQ